MKALLDTHTFLWWSNNSPELSTTARDFIADGRNEIYLSAASGWEIALKAAKGRLVLPEAPGPFVASRLQQHRFLVLPITLSHTLEIYHLPPIHTDPFDRLLVTQSQLESMPILTADQEIHKYSVGIIW